MNNLKRQAAHTLEPWVLGGCSGRMITTPDGYIGDGFIADVDTDANAQRIVACVNACEGVPTDVLENTVQRGGALMYQQERRKAAEAQRDALLAALEDIIAYNVQYATDRYGDASKAETMACVRRAREAIARAKGGAA